MKNRILLLGSILLLSLSVVIFTMDMSATNGKKDKSPVVTLSTSNYSAETKDGIVIVDFWASWCGPCRRMAPVLDEIAKEQKGTVKVAKMNVDNYKKFSIDKGIKALPTIVVYKDGKEVTRIIGSTTKEKIMKTISEYNQ